MLYSYIIETDQSSGLEKSDFSDWLVVLNNGKVLPRLFILVLSLSLNGVLYRPCVAVCVCPSTLPSLDSPYPMLVLTGPQACGKRELAHKLCREFNDFFAYG